MMNAIRQNHSLSRRQQGLTLLEILIALTLVILMSTALLYGPWGSLKAKTETENKLKIMQSSLIEAYRENLGRSELAAADGTYGTISPTGYVMFGKQNGVEKVMTSLPCTLQLPLQDEVENQLSAAQDYFMDAMSVVAQDGFRQPFCIMVSQQLSRVAEDQTEEISDRQTKLWYHRIVVVSKGENGTFDSSWDPVNGIFIQDGDDQGIVVDGYLLMQEAYNTARKKLGYVAKTYQEYYQRRFASSTLRDPTVNYYYNDRTIDGSTGTINQVIYGNNGMQLQTNGDRGGTVPVTNRPMDMSGSDLLAHFTPLKFYQNVGGGSSGNDHYYDGHAILQGLGLTEKDVEIPIKNLPSGNSVILINNSQGNQIKVPHYNTTNGVFVSSGGGNNALLASQMKTPSYTAELAVELPGMDPQNRNVLYRRIGGFVDLQ